MLVKFTIFLRLTSRLDNSGIRAKGRAEYCFTSGACIIVQSAASGMDEAIKRLNQESANIIWTHSY